LYLPARSGLQHIADYLNSLDARLGATAWLGSEKNANETPAKAIEKQFRSTNPALPNYDSGRFEICLSCELVVGQRQWLRSRQWRARQPNLDPSRLRQS